MIHIGSHSNLLRSVARSGHSMDRLVGNAPPSNDRGSDGEKSSEGGKEITDTPAVQVEISAPLMSTHASTMGGPTSPSRSGSNGAMGDKRSKLVREKSRSISAAFAASTTSSAAAGNAVSSPRGVKKRNDMTPVEATTTAHDEDDNDDGLPALFTSFCHRGLEVIFTPVHNRQNGDCYLLGMHSRTRVPFQTIPIVDNDYNMETAIPKVRIKIVQLTSHPTLGYIYAATNIGNVHSFYPVKSDPMVECYGKFRWQPGSVARCRDVFGYASLPLLGGGVIGNSAPETTAASIANRKSKFAEQPSTSSSLVSVESGEGGIELVSSEIATTNNVRLDCGPVCFYRRTKRINGFIGTTSSNIPTTPRPNNASSPGSKASVSSSPGIYPLMDDLPPLPKINHIENDKVSGYGILICASLTEKRVLIVHRDQLAIFDFSLLSSSDSREQHTDRRSSSPEALLLWTHKIRGGCIIDHATLSGDGCAIAIALRGEGVDVPYPFGVRTFVRDKDDGSIVAALQPSPPPSDSSIATPGTSTNIGGGKPTIHRQTGMSLVKPLPTHYSPPLPKRKTMDSKTTVGLLEFESENGTSVDTITASAPRIVDDSGDSKLGIIYHPAQFLVHSAPVTRLAFRGFGTRTSSANHNAIEWNEIDEGNDLLLTTCSSDCSVRIFSQNSWRQLMQWNSPPKSRADWVRGISAANLGDLDSSPTKNNNGSSSNNSSSEKGHKQPVNIPPGQIPPTPRSTIPDSSQHSTQSSLGQNQLSASGQSSIVSDASAGINQALLSSTAAVTQQPPTTFSVNSHSVPGTKAGAWIAEVTFRNTFPALRLSRLSYMKTGGDDALPAHFESVAAILPPSSIAEEVVLEETGECRIEVEGIWPAWDPWEPDFKSGRGNRHAASADSNKAPYPVGSNSPGGAAAVASPRWLGDGYDLGGSHMPPSELRLTSSHSRSDCLAQIEMPLWGDKDFGAMEFGSPSRHVMMMPEQECGDDRWNIDLPEVTLEYESGSNLCARSSLDRRSIELCWRKLGAVNMEEIRNDKIAGRAPLSMRIFQDLSLTPLPLLLPSLSLPGLSQSSTSFDKHAVSSLHWWPDENYGGPPRLVAATQGGSIIVYETPPPWSALEPPLPEYDPFNNNGEEDTRGSSFEDSDGEDHEEYPLAAREIRRSFGSIESESFSESSARSRLDYDVSIDPHPDFGIGLRLESSALGGMHAIVGSFKKHPLSGGRLPAERLGVIAVGDELLSVNEVSLEGIKFEDAIATVRQIGFDSYGSPLRMTFRRCQGRWKSPFLGSPGSRGSMISKTESGGSHATVQVGADNEIQQGFGRIIAIVRDAIVIDPDCRSLYHLRDLPPTPMLLLPWNFGKGATVSSKMYGGALIVWAVPGKCTIKAARLEAVLDVDPENARFIELGSISLQQTGTNCLGFSSISYISSTENGWLVALHGFTGDVSLLFIETACTSISKGNTSTDAIEATFRYYPNVFNSHGKSADGNKHDPRDIFILKPFSLELFGAMKRCHGGCKTLSVWSALPQALHRRSHDGGAQQQSLEYNTGVISIEGIPQLSSEEAILDFRWISSGFIEGFPWIVVFTQKSAVVYHRSGVQVEWQPIAIISYNEESRRTLRGAVSNPYDAFPHLSTALQYATLSNDEHSKRMKCDWHPESILANICTEDEGAEVAIKKCAQGLFSWLSQWMNLDASQRPSWGDRHGALSNAPFRIVHGNMILKGDKKESRNGETATAMMSTNPVRAEVHLLLSELQKTLCPLRETQDSKVSNGAAHNRSKEFMLAMSSGTSTLKTGIIDKERKQLPIPLQNLNTSELCCIWAIGEVAINPPSFKKLDNLSQFSLFCVSFMRRLLEVKMKSNKSSTTDGNLVLLHEGGRPMVLESGRPMMLMKTSESSRADVFGKESMTFDCVSSSAILSALMSDSQARLLNSCRYCKGEKFTWESARAIGTPYWVRSDKLLLSVADEIAQTVYKNTKSVMDCALFYIATRNIKKLRAIAATDRSDQGKLFLKFISDHDFSSERGRHAVEKNAYSLLRKRKYVSAASFFLLAEPPMLKTALDVIMSQLQDHSLAFFVARLMEITSRSSNDSQGGNLNLAGGFNLGSMGGGGGFAVVGHVEDDDMSQDDDDDETVKFDSWKPMLGASARSTLLSKFPAEDEDICFESLHLIWLGRRQESMLRLSHMQANYSSDDNYLVEDLSLPLSLGADENTSATSILKKTNQVINLCVGPALLKRMNPEKRVLWTSALRVSRALSRCGMEVQAIRILLQSADHIYQEGNTATIDAPPPKSKPLAQTKPVAAKSYSIFDSYDVAPPKPKPAASIQSDPMTSSIFDSFDTAPPQPKPAPSQPAQSDSMTSSIFDSYDVPPSKPKSTTLKPLSIFDAYDALPPKSTPAASPARHSSKTTSEFLPIVEKEQFVNIPSCPTLWNEWREQLINVSAARAFIREMARIVSSFDCESDIVPLQDFSRRDHSLIPHGAAEVLHNSCDSDGLLNSISKSLSELSSSFGINETAILEQASQLLNSKKRPRRILFSVLLQCLLGRGDLAEDIVRDASSLQMNSSEFLGLSNDTIFDQQNSRYYSSSLWARRASSSVIWQLELCLWLHRGGTFDMSDTALKETLLAIRVGLAVAAWGRCYHTLETLMKAEPDCMMDFDAGKNLWRSMKIIIPKEGTTSVDGVTRGGWEFLVHCRRDEATEMLRDGKCGQFLIRPHSQDPGMFTLSFKTNLIPTEIIPPASYDEAGTMVPQKETTTAAIPKKIVKRDDVVQHAIIRLADSGFRCGSFGPFATLVKLLHAVSESLPFDLRLSDPPRKGVISEKGVQTSPNSFLFRKIALHSSMGQATQFQDVVTSQDHHASSMDSSNKKRFGLFAQLLCLAEVRKQLCAVAAAMEEYNKDNTAFPELAVDEYYDGGSLSDGSLVTDDDEFLSVASRMLKPFLNWVRIMEIDIVDELTPLVSQDKKYMAHGSHQIGQQLLHSDNNASASEGDSMIRKMIQTGSGVDFRTLRVGEVSNSVIVVLFGKMDAIKWLMANETNNNEVEANERLLALERARVIESITSNDLSIPKSYAASHPLTESRYRFVDPWEVEALESRSGETASAALGRGRYQTLSVGLIASSCEKVVRSAGGVPLLGLWSALKGGLTLTKALCSAHPSWESDAGGDLLMSKGFLMEPTPYDNSIRQHLYGNYLFRRLELPQRFLALLQVELLDLKNVTSPSGSSSLTAFALLRLKRQGSTAPLNHRARSLDSACTQARKITKSSGQNAPASWGSLVRFRFPLPEDVNCEGKSWDVDRESLFKGPPTCLQITVYEKKFMSEVELGGADVNLDSLGSGGQIEEWVPLRTGKDGITWFARLRLSLRFELLCLDSSDTAAATLDTLSTSEAPIKDDHQEVRCPSVGLSKIQKLSRLGAHEDMKPGSKNSMSTPDLPHYFHFGHTLGV